MSRICGVLVLLGAGSVLVAAGGATTPQAAFKEFQAAVKAKDGDKAWNLMSKEGQSMMDKALDAMKESLKTLDKLPAEQRKAIEDKIAEQLGVPFAKLKSLDGKKLFLLALKSPQAAEKLKEVTSATLENVKVDGDKATGTVKTGSKSEPIGFVREGGSWKITPPTGANRKESKELKEPSKK